MFLKWFDLHFIFQLQEPVVTHKETNSPRPVKLPKNDVVWGERVIEWGVTRLNGGYPRAFQYSDMIVVNRDSCQVYANSKKMFDVKLNNKMNFTHSKVWTRIMALVT